MSKLLIVEDDKEIAMLERDYLELSGFEAAAPRFQAYVDSQRGYQKNKFDISPRLVRKINAKLGFYMEHYGYEMREVEEE